MKKLLTLLLLIPFICAAQTKLIPVKKNGKYIAPVVFPLTSEVEIDSANFWKPKPNVPPVPTDDTTRIDGRNSTFVGTWANGFTTNASGQTVDIGWYKNTIAYSNVAGNTVTFKFQGTKVELWAEKTPTHGTGTVTLRNGTTVVETKTVSFVGTKELPVLIYSSASIPLATYSIELKVTSGYNLLDFYVVKDYTAVVGEVPPVDPPVDPPPTGNVINVPAGVSIGTVMRGTLPANATVLVPAGLYIENQFSIPSGIKLKGAGIDKTIIKSSPSFYYQNGGTFSPEKYLIQVVNGTSSSISDLTIDGDGKQLHGGILIQNRPGSTIQNVSVKYTNFSAIWLVSSSNSIIKGIKILDCAWGSTGWCSGGLQIANSPNVDVSNFDISENEGYGIKNLGHTSNTPVTNLQIHDGRVSVNPHGAWNNGQAPNITIELWGNSFPGTAIYNTYIDNTLSLVNEGEGVRATPIKIYNNTFDINGPRAGGYGYSIELSINDAEVYGNFFNGGSAGMVNWHIKQCKGWNIHHNTFYNIARAINSQNKGAAGGGLKDIVIANNTVEMNSGVTGFIEVNGSPAENMRVENNLFFGTATNPKIISLVAGGRLVNTTVSNNFYDGLPIAAIAGATMTGNVTGSSQLTRTGAKPLPYFYLKTPSPATGKGAY